jgi:hypothetical protein
MTSGPYQSNLLRFVLGQYRQGLDRHRRAVRQARSTATLGASLGIAVTLLPVYAVVYASQQVGRKLAIASGRFGMSAKTAALLDFSDFDQSLAVEDVTAQSKTVLDSHSLIENRVNYPVEYPMVQALLAVGNCLSRAQVKLLLGMTTAAPSSQLTVQAVSRSLQQRAANLFGKNSKSKSIDRRSAGISPSQRITGIASDLQTRSLVLVLGHTTVWNGLSVVQQGQLQSQIAQFLGQETLSREISGPTPSVTAAFMTQPLKFLDANISQPLRSLSTWVKAFPLTRWPQPRQNLLQSFPATPDSSLGPDLAAVGVDISQSKPASQTLAEVSAAPSLVKTFVKTEVSNLTQPARKIAPATRPVAIEVRCDNSVDCLEADYLEADVLAVDYVEHPLEKLLKWVDRVLLRLEKWLDRWLGKWLKRK